MAVMPATITYEWTKPNALRQARERLSLTHDAVAVQSRELNTDFERIESNDLAAWERGQEEPSFDDLRTLAEIYVCPVGWFFLEQIPQERVRLDFRGMPASTHISPETKQTL